MKVQNYIMSNKSVTLVTDTGIIPILSENPSFNQIVKLLQGHEFGRAAELADVASRIKLHSCGKFYVKDGLVWIDTESLPDALSKRVIQFADAGIDIHPLLAFWNNMKKNPSKESLKDLYAFLEHNNIPITADGCFIGYKRVSDDFKDLQTHKFDNSVGKVVKMDREDVDPDRNVTCSRGLHVAAYRYAKEMYSNGVLLEVKVNPADVVAVPIDYNNEKLRCCKYTVARVCEAPRDEALYTGDESYENGDEDSFETDLETTGEIEVPVVDSTNKNINPDKRGRVCVPSCAVKDAGFSYGDNVYVIITSNGAIEITGKKVVNGRVYTVDAHNNLRVGRYLTRSYTVDSVKKGAITLQPVI